MRIKERVEARGSIAPGAPLTPALSPEWRGKDLREEVDDGDAGGGDREQKGSLYARARVADYWIVNLIDRVLEVYLDPAPAAEALYGWRYRTAQTLGADAFISPLAAPWSRIPVTDLLP